MTETKARGKKGVQVGPVRAAAMGGNATAHAQTIDNMNSWLVGSLDQGSCPV